MSEETQVSGSAVDEGVPTPTFTEKTDSPTSNVDDLAKKVAELLSPTIESKVKSLQDKRFSSIDKKLSRFEELESLGVTIPEGVKTELRQREIIERLEAVEQPRGSSPQANSQGSGKVEASEWSKVIEEVGLDLKSPETISFLRGEYRNVDHFTAEAYKLRDKVKSQPNPSIETNPSVTGKTHTRQGKEAVAEELAKLQANPNKENKARRAELAKQLRE